MNAYKCDICEEYYDYVPITKTAYAECGCSEKGNIVAFISFATEQDLCPECRTDVIINYIDKIQEYLSNNISVDHIGKGI